MSTTRINDELRGQVDNVITPDCANESLPWDRKSVVNQPVNSGTTVKYHAPLNGGKPLRTEEKAPITDHNNLRSPGWSR